MADEISLIIVIVASGITSVAVLGVVIQIFGQGILDRLNRSWKEKFEKEIIELRSKLQKDESSFLNLLHIYKSSSDEIQKQRIAAVIDLWDSIVEFKKISSPVFSIYGSLLDSEMSELHNNKKILEPLKKTVLKPEDFVKYLDEKSTKDQKLRPFISDKVWENYVVYRNFIIRLMSNFYGFLQNDSGKGNLDWKNNKGTKALLSIAITSGDLEKIYGGNFGSINFITTYLEGVLLIEIDRMFSGEYIIRDQRELFEKIKKELPNEPLKVEEMLDKPEFKLLLWGFR